jgi:acetyltransferase
LEAGDYLVKNDVPDSRKLGIVTNSGGLGVMAVDALFHKNIPVTVLSPALGRQLQKFIAPYSGTLNPICVAADADVNRYRQVLELIFAAREFATIIVIVVLNRGPDPVALLTEMRESAAIAKVNLVYVWIGDQNNSGCRAAGLSDRKTRICFTVEEAVLSCHYALRYYEKLSKLVLTPHRYSLDITYDPYSLTRARKLVGGYLERGISGLDSQSAREVISLYDLPVNPSYKVASPAEALQVCRHLGYPVVMKIDSRDIIYKSDIAGVILNLNSDVVIKKVFAKLHRIASEMELCDFSLTVEKMVEGIDYEINLGSHYDIEFGPYIFLGSGGIQARMAPHEEVILPPLDRTLARRLIDRTKFSGLCRQIRPFDLHLLENILIRVSQMVVDMPEIETLVLDPLIVSGSRLVTVDAKINLKQNGLRSPAHLATTPYPNQYEFHETLKDGTPVLIRPIKPDDAAAHNKMVAGFSPQTRYFRFFSLRDEITPEQLARFTQIDYEREIAIIAEVEVSGEKISIGVNRLLYYPHIGEYEFAIVVTDTWQHSGVGYLLMAKLIYIAKQRGIKEIFGLVMRNNTGMMNFIKRFGFEIVSREIDICRIRLALTEE